MCQYVIAKLVVSRFPKDRDIRKPWVFVVILKRVSTENKAWIPGAKPNYDVVWQRHLTDSDYRPIKPFWRVTLIS